MEKSIARAAFVLVCATAAVSAPRGPADPVAEAEEELSEARVLVGVAARAFETSRSGPGVNRVNPDPVPPLSPDDPYHSLESLAHRRLDEAKAVAQDAERRVLALRERAARDPQAWIAQDEALRPQIVEPPTGRPPGALREPITLSWTAVPGVESYAVEIQCLGCCVRGEWCVSRYERAHEANELTIPYSGPSRWRVRARTPEGYVGPASAWSLGR